MKKFYMPLFLIVSSGSWAFNGHANIEDDFCRFEPLSENVYVINGSNAKLCPPRSLEHPVTNPIAVIGKTGVVLIDPGSSRQVGQLVVERLRLVTDKPVIAIINTHIHGLYWLANHAIEDQFPSVQIYAHQRMIERMEMGEGQFWIEAISANNKFGETRIAAPKVALKGGEILNLNGVELRIHYRGHAHTDHDILVEVIKDKILILGGLVVEPEVPSQGVPHDADFKGQIAATEYAINLDMKIYIPGQGSPQGIELPRRGLHFLKALYSGVEDNFDDDLEDFEITEKMKLNLSTFEQWYHFEALGRVISEIYLQVEQDHF